MTRQNTIFGIVAIVVIVLVGAFVFWPDAVDEPAEPAATVEGGGTADTDATAPTTDESATTESESGTTEGTAN